MSGRDAALKLVREAIFSGQVPIGERTSERRLTEEHLAGSKLGRTPVREALAILTELGVVEQYPQSGFEVRRVDANEALKVLTLQALNERYIVTEAARIRIDLAPITEKANQVANAKDSPSLFDLARSFHMQLAESAGYSSAIDAISGFRDRLALFFAGTQPIDSAEAYLLMPMFRELVAHIERDATGQQASHYLEQMIDVEKSFVAARAGTAVPAVAVGVGMPAVAVPVMVG
jgi:DNA-binding GntR family transcriptional regulator